MSAGEEDTRYLELRTYTSLWQVEKRIYKIYDFTLPMPVSLRMLGIIAATIIPWISFLLLIGAPFNIESPLWVMWIAPPVVIAYLANRPIAEGKTLFDLVYSQMTFFLGQPNYYASMRAWNQPAGYQVAAYTWNPSKPPKDVSEVADGVSPEDAETSRESKKDNSGTPTKRGPRFAFKR